MTYGIIHFGGVAVVHTLPIFVLQKLTTKHVLGLPKYSSTDSLFRDLRMFSFYELHFIRTMSFLFKHKNLLEFKNKTSVTRAPSGYFSVLPSWNKAYCRYQFGYIAPTFFNSSPPNIRNSTTVKKFIKKVKNFSRFKLKS